jgi:hypothetical protein
MTKTDLSTKINTKIYYYKNTKNSKALFPEGPLNYSRISVFLRLFKANPRERQRMNDMTTKTSSRTEFHTRYSSDTGSVGEVRIVSSVISAQIVRGPNVQY